jgi:hypothetical protein
MPAWIDHELRRRYFTDIAHVRPTLIYDTDGMVCSRKDFYERFGWSPVGRDAIKLQITIGSHSYSALATYTCFGWVCWEIYIDENVDALKFQQYCQGRLKDALAENSFGIFDNASIHHTNESEEVLEEIFDGRFMYSVPYCFFDKPCELGFANVKNYIRGHEVEAANNPVGIINEAFHLYSIHGSRTDLAFNHFKPYFENHKFWMEQF